MKTKSVYGFWSELGKAIVRGAFLALLLLFTISATRVFADCSPAVTVTAPGDSGAGTLRQAITDLCADGAIDFDGSLAGQTITLTSGELVIDKNLSITGPGASSLTISGNNASRVFNVSAGVSVYLSDVTVANGHAGDGADGSVSGADGGLGADGGGIYNSGSLTVANVTFSGNTAGSGGLGAIGSNVDLGGGPGGDGGNGGKGGGIYNSGSLTVTNVTFSGNTAGSGGFGGAGGFNVIWGPGGFGGFGGSGGGIYNSGSLTVTNVTFSGNTTGSGGFGGAGGLSNGPGGFGGDGGGIYNIGSLTVTNVTFSGNTTGGGGKGISTSLGGSGGDGGGISNNGTLTVTNVTFSGNATGSGGSSGTLGFGGPGGAGGGIYNRGSLTVTNVTFSGNTTGSGGSAGRGGYDGLGGGIYNNSGTGSTSVKNTIIAGSTTGGSCAGTAFSATAANLSDDASCGGFTQSSSINLGSLGNYGGTTQTIPLLSGSSAINAGEFSSCPETDQRDVSRPQGSGCDIGAFEAIMVGVTTVASVPNPSTYGESVTLTATVTGSLATPTGTVDFSNGGTLCGGVVLVNGEATCSTSSLGAGLHTLTATYSGDSDYPGSSDSLEQTVNKATPSVTTWPTTGPITYGQALSASPLTGGTASMPGSFAFTTPATTPSAGTYSASVTFTPTDTTNYTTVTGSVNVTVNKADTTAAITFHLPNPSLPSQLVTVNYTVIVNAPGSGTPTGTVTVTDGVDSCSGTVAAGSCDIALTTSGTRTLTAAYLGDAHFNGNTSAGIQHTVYTLFSLSVTLNGTGSVASTPAGIDCGLDCDEQYIKDTVVTLNAVPEKNSKFKGWSGDSDCSDGVVNMTSDVHCTAHFYRFPWWLFWHTITKAAHDNQQQL